MKVNITPSKIHGEVFAPPSKSYAHRIIISAFLSKKPCVIENIGASADVLATVGCIKSLGADVEISGNNLIIKGFKSVKKATLNCVESGSTLRFMLPVCAALGVNATFTGAKSLLSRPNEKLFFALNSHGANIVDFTVNGKIEAGDYEIDGSISSQYISGMLLALSYLDGKSTLKILGKKVSENYIDITLDVLKDFGVNIEKKGDIYYINGKNEVKNDKFTVEGDYSGAAFLFSLAAIGGSVTTFGLKENSKQGDSKILDVLSLFGAKVKVNNGITVSSDTLKGIEYDCENIPDLVQVLSVVAAYAEGKTVLKNVSRLVYKESDRIEAILKMLSAAKIKAEFDGNDLTIYGGKPVGATFYSGNDHRSTMSEAVLATFANGNSTLIDAEAINKSYPDFFKDYKLLGGKIDVEI